MTPVTDDQVAALFPALEEAARATQRTTERFIPPRTGIVQQVAAGRHQLVVGRRGVGKTTLLLKTEEVVKETGGAVTFVDIETLKGIAYPDVLIQLLIRLFESLVEQLREGGHKREARRLKRTVRALQQLLLEPQIFERRIERGQASAVSITGRGGILGSFGGAFGLVTGRWRRKRSESQGAESSFTETKMQVLSSAVTQIRTELDEGMRRLADTKGFIMLDDFYHVRREDQPYVLGYLHQVVKNLNIYLKVGAVKHRLTSYIDGNPPVGMQPPHDVSEVSLDVTLESFAAAKLFLEKVIESITAPLGVRIEELATETARDRLVLASGGVARDYLNVVVLGLRSANDRPGSPQRPHNRITAEDVNEVAASLAEQKDQDLSRDAGANADVLRDLFQNLLTFCLDENETNVFLVDASKLEREEWGRDIQVLADLRFVHRIRNTTIQSSEYRGRQYVAFTLDLSSYTATRSERISHVEFWEPGGVAQMRRPKLIYEPKDRSKSFSREIPERVEQGKLL